MGGSSLKSTLSNRINAARRAIGDSGEQQGLIRTVPRRGLRFVADVREEANQTQSGPSAAGISPGQQAESTEEVAKHSARDGVGPLEFRGKPTVAVLPFDNMSGDPEQDYFSDGISEDIITLLSKNRSLLVIARNSAFAFKGRGSDVRHIGRELGADYVVEGGVRKLGQQLRITVHLIETQGGRLVWAEQYDRTLEQMLQVQDQITTTIAARIEPGIGSAERLRTERIPPQSLQAWDFFRLGTKHFYKSTSEDNLEAQQFFRRAIALDPDLAQAYGFLSYAMILRMLYFDAEPKDEQLKEALAIAKKGVALDDQDALVRFTYGRALLARTGLWRRARRAGRSIKAEPGTARRLLRPRQLAGLRRPVRGGHAVLREGDQSQPPRPAALGILIHTGHSHICLQKSSSRLSSGH